MKNILVAVFLCSQLGPVHLELLDHIFDQELRSGSDILPDPDFIPMAIILTNVEVVVERDNSSLFHHLDRMVTSLLENSLPSTGLQLLVLTKPPSVASIRARLAALVGKHLALQVVEGRAGRAAPRLRVTFVDMGEIVGRERSTVEVMKGLYSCSGGTSVLQPGEEQ